jgi:hypothetical protein
MVTEFNKALTLPVATTAPAKVAATPAPRFKFDDFKLKSAPAPAKVTTLPVIVVQPKPKESPCSTSAFVKSTLKGCAQGMDMLCLIPKQPPNPIMTARPQFNKILKQDDHLGAIRTGACIGGMTMGFLNQWNACQESIAKEKAAQKKTELEKLNALNFIRPGYR